MKIYTGTCAGEKIEKIKQYGLGIMISPSPTFLPRKSFVEEYEGVIENKFPCALDNGAFQAFKKGYPFQEDLFIQTMEQCYALGIKLDFIVCPDIVMGGKDSLDFSLEWARTKLKTAPRLALAVQDGITTQMLDAYVLSLFDIIFVGGSVEWKWKTADEWTKYAHKHNKKIHIGQVGQVRYLKFAEHIGVDSVDSTSIARNGSWSIIRDFIGKELF
jgi:queuine/archaeosine tRNA-ribosyltransferase